MGSLVSRTLHPQTQHIYGIETFVVDLISASTHMPPPVHLPVYMVVSRHAHF